MGRAKEAIIAHLDEVFGQDMGRAEVEAFLTHLAVEGNVAASTQNQAFSALLFLYREVLKVEFDAPLDSIRAKKPARLPVVLTRAEARQVIEGMSGIYQLMAKLLYGSGLRLMECVRLRVKDVDFARREITVRDAKGGHERVTMLPESLIAPLQEHLKRVKLLHEQDMAAGFGQVYLPYALDRKYPNASREWGWQYVFPSDRLSTDPRTGLKRRHTCTCAAACAGRPGQVQVPCRREQLAAHCPRTPRPQRRQNHHDLHPRPQSRRTGGPTQLGTVHSTKKHPSPFVGGRVGNEGGITLSPSAPAFSVRSCGRRLLIQAEIVRPAAESI